MGEADAVLRRVERTSVAACAAMALAAWVVARGGLEAPVGVVGGGLLVAISYRGIRAGIDAAMATGKSPRAVAIGLVKFFTRYAILSGAAYVIMARLRLPPAAVIAGASSLVLAVMFEALRSLRR